MKCKLALSLALLTFGFTALAQTSSFYENDGLVFSPPDIPPNIDATTFINANQGQFIINFTNDLLPNLFFGFGMLPFETQNTLNYSNGLGGFMACNTGFRFETFDSNLGRRHSASNFLNAGTINCGTVDTLNFLELDLTGWFGGLPFINVSVEGAKCLINSANIVNPGTIHVGFEGALDLHGGSVDLSYGTLESDITGADLRGVVNGGGTFNGGAFFNGGGIFDGYWGVGNVQSNVLALIYPNGISPRAFFGGIPPETHEFIVTERNSSTLINSLGGPNFVGYLNINTDFSGTNVYTTAVFVANTNPLVQVNVYFTGSGFGGPAIPVLEYTNLLGTSSNNVYVQDLFGATTNLQLILNGTAGARATAIPFNYSVAEFPPIFFFGTPSPPVAIPPSTFPAGNVTNDWTAYQAILAPTSVLLGDVTGQNFTNVPGGIKIVADNYLNLSNAHINALNYMLLKSTNHFDYGPDAQISSPVIDVTLRSTNGTLLVSNLFTSTLPRPGGDIDLFSARWTNVFTNIFPGTVTNHFHVLFADAHFSPVSPTIGQDVTLRATGAGSGDSIIISDFFTISHSLLLDAANITIATNSPGTDPLVGAISIAIPGIIWPDAAPRLQNFTNNGIFTAVNTVFFGGSRHSPYYTTTFTEPYKTFINTGFITNYGSIIEATIFQNSGIVDSTGASVNLTSDNAVLTNGVFFCPSGGVTIASSSLIISNHALIAGGGPISLSASYLLDDGTLAAGCPEMVTNKNVWIASGFNLTRLPTYATLLSTTVTNTAPVHNSIPNIWAGNDVGNDPAGFNPNNAPLGRLILDGHDPTTRFTFTGASANNALYVDYLELENFTTNYDAVNQLYTEVSFAPNIKIYFAQAMASGVSIAEKLNGANAGHFVWVSNYNCGPFSSVLLTNQIDGTTYAINQALRESHNLDSDGDTIINYLDPSPVPLPVPACPCAAFIPPPLSVASPSLAPGGSSNSVSGSPQLDPPATPPSSGPANQTVSQNKGSYTGLFFDTNAVSPASAGSFSATVTDKGAFTGRLVIGGKTYSLSGNFDAHGLASAKVSRGALHSLNLLLHLDLSGANQISGSISDSHWTAQLLANRLVFDARKNPASQFVGSYNLDIPGDASGDNRPAGDGFATVKIDAAGSVQVAGSLADSSKLSLKSSLSQSGSWPVYVSLYQGAGCGLGWLQVTNHNLAGRFLWIKPGGLAGSTAKSYSSGFTNRIDTTGLPYHSPASGQSLFSWNFGNLILNGGGLTGSHTNLIFINDKNRLTISDDPSLKLTITPASGLFQGSLLNPDTGKAFKFQGALFQDFNIGLGYFLNSDQSGQIYLGPSP